MISRSSRCMVSNPLTCCSVMRWASTPRGMGCPQHKKTEGAFRPLERGLEKQLKTYFDDLNRHPKPIQWTYTKTKLLAKFGTSQPTELAAYFPRAVLSESWEIALNNSQWEIIANNGEE